MSKTILAATLASFFALPLHAASLVYDFEAERSFNGLDDAVVTGLDALEGITTLTGRILFDDTLDASPPVAPPPNSSFYGAATFAFDQFDLADLGDPESQSLVTNDGLDGDIFGTVTTGPSAASSFFLILADSTGTVFTDQSFPDRLRLDDFDFINLIFFDGDGSGNFEQVVFEFKSLTAVPIPASGLLLIAGLGALGFARLRQ